MPSGDHAQIMPCRGSSREGPSKLRSLALGLSTPGSLRRTSGVTVVIHSVLWLAFYALGQSALVLSFILSLTHKTMGGSVCDQPGPGT